MAELPFLTAELPGTGGVIKRQADDFVVEEIPLYRPSGTGTHLYLQIEKRGLTTEQAVEAVARAAGVRRRDIGYAGLKDARAVARQTLSVEHVEPDRLRKLAVPGLRILALDRHTNKLKLGHLAGNRFAVRVREAVSDAARRAEPVVEVLTHRGVPNYFGPQRFGLRGDNGCIGLAALRGDYDEAIALMLGRPNEADGEPILSARRHFEAGDYRAAADAWPRVFRDRRRACLAMGSNRGKTRRVWRSLDWHSRRMYLSALQSALFNQVVARRLGGIDRVLVGDLAQKHANRAVFRVEDAETEQPRCAAFEISATGPLFGRRMTVPEGEPAAIEAAVLDEAGLSTELLSDQASERIDGARRSLRVVAGEVELETGQDQHGPWLGLRFTLPPGAYATTLLREVCKHDHPALPNTES